MDIQQLSIFSDKKSFNPASFESVATNDLFYKLADSVYEAFNEKFLKIDISELDSTTRANILNNLVLKTIEKNCYCNNLKFIKSLTNTRRGFAILNDEYLMFFKKYPVSNLKTDQDDLIKTQSLDKHIIFLVYRVDIFWSSISSIKLQYILNYESVIYEKNISNTKQNIHIPIESNTINLKVKEELIAKKIAK